MAKIATKTIDAEAGTVTFAFSTGEKVVAKLDRLSKNMLRQLALHGVSQKIGDSYASLTAVEAHEAAKEQLRRLTADEWFRAREGGSSLPSALARATGKSIIECAKAIRKMDDEGKKALRANPIMRKALAEIRTERATKAAEGAKVDSLEGLFKES